ncbi:MAG: HAD family hydrolase [Methylococcaceae bacterium]|jgi:phosphoglycolate phosphatase-like HAD superfamily hydrolase
MIDSKIYAFDFDGVICDSVLETAISGWKAAGIIWGDMPKTAAPQNLLDQFRLVRPIIETGYESILGMRLLYLGESIEAIYSGYQDKTQFLISQAGTSTDELKKLFEQTRDTWIAEDLAAWVAMNPLYPGVVALLNKLSKQSEWVVVTTKQERFVNYILKANAIDLEAGRIFGLDRQMLKAEVLKSLLNGFPDKTVYFIEDRLATLLNILKEKELAKVKLMFALWGYSTESDRIDVGQKAITALTFDEFLGLSA